MAGDTDLLADPIDVVRIFNEIKDTSINATLHMYHMGHATFLIGKDMSFMNDVFQILKDWEMFNVNEYIKKNFITNLN